MLQNITYHNRVTQAKEFSLDRNNQVLVTKHSLFGGTPVKINLLSKNKSLCDLLQFRGQPSACFLLQS